MILQKIIEAARTPQGVRTLRGGCVLALCAMLFVKARVLLGDTPILGDDHSSHLAAIAHLAALLRQGRTDFYCPTFNLGFPMGLYYQPFPHLGAALVHLVSFGALSVTAAFNLTVVGLVCLYPAAVFFGTRRLMQSDDAALGAAFCAPLVTSALPFGLTLHSVMGLGLYTQLWAMVILPLALGTSWAAVQGEAKDPRYRTGLGVAAAWMTLLWLCHAFYGLAAATLVVVMTLVQPSALARTLPRLAVLGGLTMASLLFWLLPLGSVAEFAGGWPWGSAEQVQGYGAPRVLSALVRGRVLDDGRLPVVTIAFTLGVAFSIWSARRSPVRRWLLLGAGLMLGFLMGRPALGPLVDILPANRGIQLFRYIGPFHMMAIFVAGFGLYGIGRFLARPLGGAAAVAILGALLFPALADWPGRAGGLLRTGADFPVQAEDLRALGRAIDGAVARGTPPGRVYAHEKTRTGTHLISALLSLHTRQPMGQSYGVSMHDALGFFYLEYLDPMDSEQMGLYNFRFVLADRDAPFAVQLRASGHEPLAHRGTLQLFRLEGPHGYFRVVELDGAIVGTPRQVRPLVRRWLASGWPAAGRFVGVVAEKAEVPRGVSWVLSTRGPEAEEGDPDPLRVPWPERRPARRDGPPGQILSWSMGPGRFEAEARMARPGALSLAMGYHPYWRATLDGKPVPALMLAPAFIGVQVPAGHHRVHLGFHNPTWQKVLLALTVAAWVLVPLGLWRGRRRL